MRFGWAGQGALSSINRPFVQEVTILQRELGIMVLAAIVNLALLVRAATTGG